MQHTYKQIPTNNINYNNFEVWIVNSDNQKCPVNILMDSGCMYQGVIGSEILNKASIDFKGAILSFKILMSFEDKIYEFTFSVPNNDSVFKIVNREIYSNRKKQKKFKTQKLGHAGVLDGQNIHIILGLPFIKAITKNYFLIPSVNLDFNFNNKKKIYFPYNTCGSNKSSYLGCLMNDTYYNFAFDTGSFLSVDLLLSNNFFLEHIASFKNIRIVKDNYFVGEIDIKLKYKKLTLNLPNLHFGCFLGRNPTNESNLIVDIIGNVQLIKKLSTENIILKADL